jgi:hypothetical protein
MSSCVKLSMDELAGLLHGGRRSRSIVECWSGQGPSLAGIPVLDARDAAIPRFSTYVVLRMVPSSLDLAFSLASPVEEICT